MQRALVILAIAALGWGCARPEPRSETAPPASVAPRASADAPSAAPATAAPATSVVAMDAGPPDPPANGGEASAPAAQVPRPCKTDRDCLGYQGATRVCTKDMHGDSFSCVKCTRDKVCRAFTIAE